MTPVFTVLLLSCLFALTQSHAHHDHDHLKTAEVGKQTCGVKDLDAALVALNEEVAFRAIATKNIQLDHLTDAKSWKLVTIKTYIHILKTTTLPGPTQQQIDAQMKLLNDEIREAGFKFKLVSVDTYVNDEWAYFELGTDLEATVKNQLRKGDASDLNFYITQDSVENYGWATFPSDYLKSPKMDGVVCLGGTMPGGEFTGFNTGKTLVHEVGHWLGLYHTFQGGCNANAGLGDSVADTPAVQAPDRSCNKNRDSCPSPFFPGKDLIDNHMDYTSEICRTDFTPGQIARMRTQWKAFRA